MKELYWFLGTLAVCILIYQMRVLPFREKKTTAPKKTAHARLIGREVIRGTHGAGRSSGMGYSYLLTFVLDDGTQIQLYAHDVEFGALKEGDSGSLTWQGRYYMGLETA